LNSDGVIKNTPATRQTAEENASPPVNLPKPRPRTIAEITKIICCMAHAPEMQN